MMREIEIKGAEYSVLIPTLLDDQTIGLIHSIFKTGFNLSFGDSLLFIGKRKNERLPFGIHLLDQEIENILERIHQKESVFWDKNTYILKFPDTLISISLKNSYPFKSCIGRIKDTLFDLKHLDSFVNICMENGYLTGFNIELERIGELMRNNKPTNELERAIVYFSHAILNDHYPNKVEHLKYFMGRGKGLTPSGDDMLVGLLSVLIYTSQIPNSWITWIGILLKDESLTTDVSRAYLKNAVSGRFSSVINEVIQSFFSKDVHMFHRNVSELLSMGHSSGADTMLGILCGLYAIRRQNYG